jgi:hypothetical protein
MKNPISQLMAAVKLLSAAPSAARMPQLDRTGRDVFGVVHAERVTR